MNSGVYFTGWVLSVLVRTSWYRFSLVWLGLVLHRIFNLAKFFHKIRIFFAVVAKSRHIFSLLPAILDLAVLFLILVRVSDGSNFVLFGDVRGCSWLLESISIWCIGCSRLSLNLAFPAATVAIIWIIFTVRRSVVFLFNLFNPHICPGVSWLLTGSKIRLRLMFILTVRCSHCYAWHFVEAIFSFHFNNKNIILL